MNKESHGELSLQVSFVSGGIKLDTPKQETSVINLSFHTVEKHVAVTKREQQSPRPCCVHSAESVICCSCSL